MFDPNSSKKYDVTIDYSNNANCLYKICDLLLDKIELKLRTAENSSFVTNQMRVYALNEFSPIVEEFNLFYKKLNENKSFDPELISELNLRFSNIQSNSKYKMLVNIIQKENPERLFKIVNIHIDKLKEEIKIYNQLISDPATINNALTSVTKYLITCHYEAAGSHIEIIKGIIGDEAEDLDNILQEAMNMMRA